MSIKELDQKMQVILKEEAASLFGERERESLGKKYFHRYLELTQGEQSLKEKFSELLSTKPLCRVFQIMYGY